MSSNNSNSLDDNLYNSNSKINSFEYELKLKLLEKALARLEDVSEKLFTMINEQHRLNGFISTCKSFFEEDKDELLVARIEQSLQKIKVNLQTSHGHDFLSLINKITHLYKILYR